MHAPALFLLAVGMSAALTGGWLTAGMLSPGSVPQSATPAAVSTRHSATTAHPGGYAHPDVTWRFAVSAAQAADAAERVMRFPGVRTVTLAGEGSALEVTADPTRFCRYGAMAVLSADGIRLRLDDTRAGASCGRGALTPAAPDARQDAQAGPGGLETQPVAPSCPFMNGTGAVEEFRRI